MFGLCGAAPLGTRKVGLIRMQSRENICEQWTGRWFHGFAAPTGSEAQVFSLCAIEVAQCGLQCIR